MERLSVDATPDKSLMAKLGMVGYKTEEAIAELVDNAIDARIDGKVGSVEVLLLDPPEIVIRDDGHGMDIAGLKKAWTLGGGSGESDGRIGRFGIGLKSASSALGKHVKITTKIAGSGHELVLEHDEDEWINDKDAGWGNVGVERREAEVDRHGTEVCVSDLRLYMSSSYMKRLRDWFGVRYGPFIKNEEIRLSVYGKECVPKEPEIEYGTKKEVCVENLDGVRIRGWVAVLKKRSIRGDYGVHLYSKGRLIKPYAKFGIPTHPTAAKFIGSVELENLPVNVFKTEFFTQRGDYEAAEKVFRSDPAVKETLKEAAKRSSHEYQVKKILNPPDYPQKIRLPRLGENEANRLLESIGTELIETDYGPNIRLEDGGSGLYRIEENDGAKEIVVNRQSEVFRAFRNPLHLLVMIQADAEIFSENPQARRDIEVRNSKWERRISNLVNAKPKISSLRNEDMLVGELRGLCDHIVKKYHYKFQFTALSTLATYLNQTYRKIAYTVYTVNGYGDSLAGMIRNHGEFDALLEPTYPQLSTAFGMVENKDIVVIREYASIPKSVVATFDKSWVDLFVEVKKKRMRNYEVELEMVEGLLNLDMVTRSKILAWAKRRKVNEAVEKYLEVQHSDS
ncbi:MAG: ATP-binding protein [Thaumarchaeota archaeon]|nr:ATP-binding protein [Nitrososphaerota archaeon]